MPITVLIGVFQIDFFKEGTQWPEDASLAEGVFQEINYKCKGPGESVIL